MEFSWSGVDSTCVFLARAKVLLLLMDSQPQLESLFNDSTENPFLPNLSLLRMQKMEKR